jgi:hypothetical protein
MRRLSPFLALLIAVLGLAALPQLASSHPERPTSFPEQNGVPPKSEIPTFRSSGPYLVVCKPGSAAVLRKEYKGAQLRHRLRILKRCKFADIQPAVDAAKSGDRVIIMPGRYEEMASRKVPFGAYHDGSKCGDDYAVTEGFGNTAPPPAGPRSNDPPVRPNRNFHLKCPNAHNLIMIAGDSRPETNVQSPSVPECNQRCNLQIEGYGKEPEDVLIVGDRKKTDVIRADRAWGLYLRNFAVEQASFNNIDVVETSGFRISRVVSRYAQNYGILTFTSVNGVYDHDVAYGNGDSGLYPGSTEKGCDVTPNAYATCNSLVKDQYQQQGCQRYSIEIRDSESYGNTLGYSGTAGNSTWVHDNKFHDNATGLTTDSFAAGHPGMPQECVKWENNDIYSNNNNVFSAERQDYCAKTPFPVRKVELVCPQFQSAVGTGILIGGGNRNLIRNNRIYDNHRWGMFLIGVPASLRNDNDPDHQRDTSNGNRFMSNTMGKAPDGSTSLNGLDVEWDGQGVGNCWQGNTSGGNSSTTLRSDPASLPDCPGSAIYRESNPKVLIQNAPCTAWDPYKMPNPPGCDWFTTPPKPK